MYISNYKTLYSSLINNCNADEFVDLRKNKRHVKVLKFGLGVSYTILSLSLIVGVNQNGLILIVSGLILALYFQSRIKSSISKIEKTENTIDAVFKNNLSNNKINEFREEMLSNLINNSITKSEFLSVIREDLNLNFHLIKRECEDNGVIDIVKYEASVGSLFGLLDKSVNNGFLNENESKTLKKKWSEDIQVLCNQYNKTDLEVELKYLKTKLGK